MPSLRASLLARHAHHDAELTRRRQHVLAELATPAPAASPRLFLLTLWRELFVAARPAWAGLACVWLVLLALSASQDRAASPLASTTSPAPASSTPAPIIDWQARERALAALLAPSPPLRLAPPTGAPTSFLAPRRAAVLAT